MASDVAERVLTHSLRQALCVIQNNNFGFPSSALTAVG